MKKNTIVILFASLALAFNFSVSHAENLLETAQQAGSFKIFVSAIKRAGLTQKLDEGGPYTIFAPDDHAFSRLPEGEWESISKNKMLLARLLNYHIIQGKVKITEIKPGSIASLEGNLLKLKSDNGLVTVNGISVTQSDLVADNGVIHAIEEVLIPPE